MSRLSSLRVVDLVLTEVALGYKTPQFVHEVLFPVIPGIKKESVRIPIFGKESFKKYNTTRAIRAQRARYDFSVSSMNVVLEEESFEVPVDDREAEEFEDYDLLKPAVKMAKRVVELGIEYKAASLARDPNNYDANNVLTLSGTSQWNDYSNSDPIDNVEDMKDKVKDKIGIKPNVMVLGDEVERYLKHHPKITDRIKYSMKGVITPDLLAEVFGIEKVVIGASVYYDESTGTFVDIWGKDVILAYVPEEEEIGIGVPAYGYKLRKKDRPKAYKYRDERANSTIVVYDDIVGLAVTSIYAGALIQNAVA